MNVCFGSTAVTAALGGKGTLFVSVERVSLVVRHEQFADRRDHDLIRLQLQRRGSVTEPTDLFVEIAPNAPKGCRSGALLIRRKNKAMAIEASGPCFARLVGNPF